MADLKCLLATRAPVAAVLVWLLVGGVFLLEGVMKFLLAGELGAGRFARIGIPWPEAMGTFVGAVEIIAGTMVLAGLATRQGRKFGWHGLTRTRGWPWNW